MNYLSHFFLSAQAAVDVHLGNFLGDILRKSAADTLPISIQKGIDLHRFIDQFTDNHPLVLDGKRLLYPEFGKYASVILDVYFDFLLIENWSKYERQPLQKFIDTCYEFIDANMEFIPEGAKPRVLAMNSAQWMNGYLTDDGRRDLFRRLARRARYDKNFGLAVDIYGEKKPKLMYIHEAFFPILQQASNEWLEKQNK